MRKGIVRCLVAAILFGATTPAASRLVREMGAFTLAGLLYLGAAVFVLPFAIRSRPTKAAVVRGSFPLAVAVVLGGAVGPVLLAAGLGYVPAATASLLLNLELVFTAIVASLFFGEHLGRGVITGTAFMVVAGLTLSWSGGADLRLGALLISGACLCWGIDNCVTASMDQFSPSQITLVKGIIAGGTNLAIGLVLNGAPSGTAILGALIVGGFGYGISIMLWIAGARDLGAARAQLVFATAPFVGVIIAWTVFAEAITPKEIVAFFLAACGASFVARTAHLHQHQHQSISHEHEHRHDDAHHIHTHADEYTLSHSHVHQHEELAHSHPHVPDLHHRHDH